jgi:hypothetical protein
MINKLCVNASSSVRVQGQLANDGRSGTRIPAITVPSSSHLSQVVMPEAKRAIGFYTGRWHPYQSEAEMVGAFMATPGHYNPACECTYAMRLPSRSI